MLVVVPAHNEQEFLGNCLTSLEHAADKVLAPTEIVVVLDACTDATAAVVGSRARTITVNHHNVGAARAAGFASAGAGCRAETWFATTDADTVVEPDWLAHQLQRSRAGAQMVVGTVVIADWLEHSPNVRERYLRGYHPREGHRHVHGANLGVRADIYWAVGGFTGLPCGEDVDLVERVSTAGARVSWTADAPVRTSGRPHGRVPLGFAAHLRSLDPERLCRTFPPAGVLP